MEQEHELDQDPTEDLAGSEQMIYEVLMAKTGFNNPVDAVAMAKRIFHCIDSQQGKNTHAEDYSNPKGELSAKLISPDALALESGISKDLAMAILVRLNILDEGK